MGYSSVISILLLGGKIMGRRGPLLVVMVFVLLAVLPCYAYGDPTGGALFQILLPVLAAIWGMWLIFANNIRRRASNLLRKLRGTSPDQ
jgi:hypothetical protein